MFDFTQITNRDKSSENSHSIDAKKRGGIARFFAHLPHKTEKLISVDYSKAEQIRILQLLGMGGGLDVISNYVPFDAKTFADKIYEIERAVDHSSVNKKNKNDFLQGFSSLKLLLQKAMSPASLSELDVYLEKKASNYVQTMNFQQRTWHYDMTRLLWPVEVATENLGRNTVLINGVPVSFLFAKRDIEIGEVLGFDYGLGYWVHKNCLPLLLNKDGSILPESQYRYMFMWLESTRAEAKLLNEKITYCCTRDAYFSNVDTQLPLQIGVFEKPRSFFEVRDLFVENNVLPIFHGAITSVYFAEQLRRLFSSISSVVVKAYYHDPDTGEELAQYSVDVVCRFSEFRQWAHLTSWIKPQPIKQFVKCYEHSQEIIFRGVNVDKMPEMMQTLCNTLQSKMPLSEWLNQEHWHRQPSARSIFYESRDGRYCCISMPE